ncbi:MAG: DUF58 domain-containing protein, partial [Chlamydiae bacterium]|nr:DUF58 domain-containing protein [Chlamydiota bacterium]
SVCKRFDFVAIGVNDPREKSMPTIGILDLEDPETGAVFSVKTTEHLSLSLRAHLIAIEKLFAKYKTDFLSLSTTTPYEKALVSFFHTRTRR